MEDKRKRIKVQEELKKIKLSDESRIYLNQLLDNDKLGLKLNYEEKKEELIENNNYSFLIHDKSKDIDNQSNISHLLIEGDNYFALKHLIKLGVSVDIIYIDPPYNTGNDDTGLLYNNTIVDKNDTFKHSKFLSFMKKRLECAFDILRDNGVIFVAIDDEEMAYLKVLMDEIFGEDSFVSAFPIRSNPNGRTIKGVIRNHEYILVYEKNIEGENNNFRLKDYKSDKLTSFRRGGDNSLSTERPMRFYPLLEKEGVLYMIDKSDWVKIHEDKKQIINEEQVVAINKKYADFNIIWPIDKKGERRVWQRKFERAALEINKEILFINGNIKTTPIEEKNISTWLDDEKFSYSHHGASILNNIIPDTKFRYPKSVYSIKHLIETVAGDSSVILDFFAGSGTTGHAVMEMNRDGGKHKFIGVTLGLEKSGINICEEVAYERLYRIIEGSTTKGGKDFPWIAKQKNVPYKENLRYAKLNIINKFEGNELKLIEQSSFYKEEFGIDKLNIETIGED